MQLGGLLPRNERLRESSGVTTEKMCTRNTVSGHAETRNIPSWCKGVRGMCILPAVAAKGVANHKYPCWCKQPRGQGDSVHIPQQFAFPDRTDFLQWLSLSIQVHREVSHGILTGSRERLGCLGCQKLGEGIIAKGPEGERLNFETPGSSVSVNCFDPEESRQLGDY